MKKHFAIATAHCLLLAFILATGVALAWGAACGSFWDAVHRRQRVADRYEEYVVQIDGTPAIVTRSVANYSQFTARTLQGQPLEPKPQLHGSSLPGAVQLAEYALSRKWEFRVTTWEDGGTPAGHWYFIHDGRVRGRAWFEGFDSVTRRQIGFIGRRGFTDQQPDEDDLFPFDARLRSASGFYGNPGYSFGLAATYLATSAGARSRIERWAAYLVSNGELWEIDLQRRSARTLLASADLVSAAVVERAVPANAYPQREPAQDLVARSSDRLWVIDPRSGATRQFPLSAALQDDDLEVYELGDGLLLRTGDRFRRAKDRSPRFVWLDSQGKIIREVAAPPKERASANDDSWRAAMKS